MCSLKATIKKDKTAFAFSVRRTYLDALIRPFMKPDRRGGYYFYDLNAKIHHKINNKHHLYLSGYFGQDKASIRTKYEDTYGGNTMTSKQVAGLNWGNGIGAFRWNYFIGPKIMLNTTLTYSKYAFNIGAEEESYSSQTGVTSKFGFNYLSGINDWSGKMDFAWFPDTKNTVRFGYGAIYHTFRPGVTSFEYEDDTQAIDTTFGSFTKYAMEPSVYIENDQAIGSRLKLNFGLRLSSFFVGDTSYMRLEPRFALNYLINEKSSFKLGYSRNAQYLHMLSNTGIALPTDLRVPVTERVGPVTANQVSMGYAIDFLKKYSATVEVYYKKMDNLVQYKEGSDFLDSAEDWQDKVEVGQGWSYGAEFFFEKRIGKLSGWTGYTLSWTQRQFDNVNNGDPFYYRYDRRHDVSVAMSYEMSKTWDFGLVFVFGTGNAVSLPSQYYSAAGNPMKQNYYWGEFNQTVPYYKETNGYRMPAYHRMDIGFNRKTEKKSGNFDLVVFSL